MSLYMLMGGGVEMHLSYYFLFFGLGFCNRFVCCGAWRAEGVFFLRRLKSLALPISGAFQTPTLALLEVLLYGWEVYHRTARRCTTVQTGAVLWVSLSSRLRARKARRCKWVRTAVQAGTT